MKKRNENLELAIIEFARFTHIPLKDVTAETKLGRYHHSFATSFCRRHKCIAEKISATMTLRELASFKHRD